MPEIIKRKALTIEDLIKFCQTNNMYSFNSKEQGYRLSVQVPATFEVDENIDEAHRGMLKLKFRIFHTGLNRNGSFVSEEAAKDAMPTIKNRPIMAAIHQLDNGEWDFEAHNFEIVKNEETGEEEVVYIEKQVGSFDESEPFFEYDEKLDKTYICGYGYIAEDYTKAADIIRRKNGTKNSCELNIDEFSYNGKEHYLSLDKFYVAASTLLGCKADGTEIGEGMLGSRADIADFSQKNNSLMNYSDKETNQKLIETLDKLNNTLSKFNINQAEISAENYSKEGGNIEVSKFEELLAKYNKTEADIEFEVEGLSDEELEQKFAEVFGEVSNEEDPASEEGENSDETDESEESESEESDETEDFKKKKKCEEESEESEDNEDEEDEENSDDTELTETEACGKKKKKCSISVDEVERTFELSLDDIQYALYSLVNDMYSEADNTYYGVTVYDTYVVMHDWWNGRNFKQSFAREDDNFSLVGDRVEVYTNWLTKEEEESLAELRSNYAALVQYKEDMENAQLHSQREEILNNEKYSVLAEKDENNEYKNEAYAKLVSEMDNYSLVDLEKELKSVFADYITNGGQFAYNNEVETKPSVSKKLFAKSTEKKPSRYGNLFNK